MVSALIVKLSCRSFGGLGFEVSGYGACNAVSIIVVENRVGLPRFHFCCQAQVFP